MPLQEAVVPERFKARCFEMRADHRIDDGNAIETVAVFAPDHQREAADGLDRCVGIDNHSGAVNAKAMMAAENQLLRHLSSFKASVDVPIWKLPHPTVQTGCGHDIV
jgi:hypothetical protein